MDFFTKVPYKAGVAKELRELLRTTKIVLLTGYERNDVSEFYDKLSEDVGQWAPMDEDLKTGTKTGAKWIEIKYDPQFPDSYRHSNTRQPLHTDGSYESNAPPISFFYCVRAAAKGGETTFLDSGDLLRELESYSPSLLRKSLDQPLTFAKGKDSKTRPIVTQDDLGMVLTWNYFRVVEDSSEAASLRRDFHAFLEEMIVPAGLCFACHLKPGDAVFFNDERVLHGRNSFAANRVGERHLLKSGLFLRTTD